MLEYLEKAVELAKNLIPPSDGDPIVIRRWRWFIVGVTLLNSTGLLVHILLACGYVPFYPGFAQAGELSSLRQQAAVDAAAIKAQVASNAVVMQERFSSFEEDQKQRRISTLKKELLELQTKRCAAPTGPARQLFLVSIQEGLTEYNRLTGLEYPLPGCDAF